MTRITLPWETHGPLRVSRNGHYLEHSDGTGFFWLGDTAWHLARLETDDVVRYMDNRAGKGFNVVQVYASQDPSPAFGGRNFAGEVAFQGAGPPFPAATLNEAYWRHVDFIVDQARDHGLYLALTPAWGMNTDTGPRQYFADPDTHNYEYGRILGARYRDQPHILWFACAEYHTPYGEAVPPAHLARLKRLAAGILDGNQGSQLMAMHPLSRMTSSDDFHGEPWLSFNTIQTHVFPESIPSLVYGDWQRLPAKPTLNAEGWYEGEEPLFISRRGIHTVAPLDPGWVQRYQAYWSVFHGSIGYSYGHRSLWTFLANDQRFPFDLRQTPGVLPQAALNAPGAADLRHLRTLMESRSMTTHMPDPALLALNTTGIAGAVSPSLRCATRDEDGRWAYVYTSRGEVIGLVMHRLAKGLADAYWYNPRCGLWHAGGQDGEERQPVKEGVPSGPGAPVRYFTPPGQPEDGNDWVLVVEVRAT